jgi:hypothetical protein
MLPRRHVSGTQPTDLDSAALGIGRHVSGIADPVNGQIDEFRLAHVQRSDGWIETNWNNMSDTPWSSIVETSRPGRLELYGDGFSCLQHSNGDQDRRPVRHLPLGLVFSRSVLSTLMS